MLLKTVVSRSGDGRVLTPQHFVECALFLAAASFLKFLVKKRKGLKIPAESHGQSGRIYAKCNDLIRPDDTEMNRQVTGPRGQVRRTPRTGFGEVSVNEKILFYFNELKFISPPETGSAAPPCPDAMIQRPDSQFAKHPLPFCNKSTESVNIHRFSNRRR
jgi:hypothetical protein